MLLHLFFSITIVVWVILSPGRFKGLIHSMPSVSSPTKKKKSLLIEFSNVTSTTTSKQAIEGKYG